MHGCRRGGRGGALSTHNRRRAAAAGQAGRRGRRHHGRQPPEQHELVFWALTCAGVLQALLELCDIVLAEIQCRWDPLEERRPAVPRDDTRELRQVSLS